MSESNIVLTNGVFDIIHRGHIKLLEFCKTHGNYLIVAIDSDERVKQIKGNFRPINSQNDRKLLLESIRYVDEVIIFHTEEELRQLHISIKPHVFVKGSEYNITQMNNIAETTKIIPFTMLKNYSTTNMIEKIQLLPTHLKELQQ